MKPDNYPLSRQHNIVIQELENEILIYDLLKNKAFCLNQTSAMVWQECDGKRTVEEISLTLAKKLNLNVSEEFVWLALDELKKDNLLENGEDLDNHFAGLTRREAVRKVGLASMVALPVISSLIAPKAVMAVSGPLPIGSACTSNPECNSNNCVATISGGPTCCIFTGSPNNISPGGFTTTSGAVNNLTGQTDCYFSQLECDATSNIDCCSGSATATAPDSNCPVFATLHCVCN